MESSILLLSKMDIASKSLLNIYIDTQLQILLSALIKKSLLSELRELWRMGKEIIKLGEEPLLGGTPSLQFFELTTAVVT